MNLKHTIRKVLKEDRTKSLINQVLRRVRDLDNIVDGVTEWALEFYSLKMPLDKMSVEDFITRVIYGVYIDYISPIFESWEEQEGELDIPTMTIGKGDESKIEHFLRLHYKDRITKKFLERINKNKQITESEIPINIRRRLKLNEEEIINLLKAYAIKYSYELKKNSSLSKEIKLNVIVRKACRATLFDLIDSTQLEFGEDTFISTEDSLNEFLQEKYGDQLKEFIRDFFDESGDEFGSRYVFQKHSEKSGGGSGFSESYETWNMLLNKFASYFPDLDWKELKTRLDNMNSGGKILIKKPGDINNSMNYYFSLQRFDKK